MKVEVACINEGCSSFSFVQLRRAQRTGIGLKPWYAYDEDGNVLTCGMCNDRLQVVRLSTGEAQFAAGDVVLTERATAELGPDAFVAAEQVAPHFRAHVNGAAEVSDRLELVSDFVVNRRKFLIVTNNKRTETVVMEHDEWPLFDW